MPDFAVWDWSPADTIDEQLRRTGLKCGILGGYFLWDMVEVTMADLRECAVDVRFFPGKPRKLGILERAGELSAWEPDRETSWYESIVGGRPCDKTEPLLLRPAVASEFPARWYIEDGSGRATALVANEVRFRGFEIIAVGYLGTRPDLGSQFMQKHFSELIRRRSETR